MEIFLALVEKGRYVSHSEAWRRAAEDSGAKSCGINRYKVQGYVQSAFRDSQLGLKLGEKGGEQREMR